MSATDPKTLAGKLLLAELQGKTELLKKMNKSLLKAAGPLANRAQRRAAAKRRRKENHGSR